MADHNLDAIVLFEITDGNRVDVVNRPDPSGTTHGETIIRVGNELINRHTVGHGHQPRYDYYERHPFDGYGDEYDIDEWVDVDPYSSDEHLDIEVIESEEYEFDDRWY